MKGKRKSFWLPLKDYWIEDAITDIRRKVEKEEGVKMSEGDVIRHLLRDTLKGMKPDVSQQKDSGSISEGRGMALPLDTPGDENETTNGIHNLT